MRENTTFPGCPAKAPTAIIPFLGRGVLPACFRKTGVPRVRNSMAAGRGLVLRALGLQAAVALGLALVFLLKDSASAMAAGIGGGAVVVGSALLGLRAFASDAASAGLALARLLAGMILKWVVVFGALYLALVRYGLPPLPLLAGLTGTTLAFLLIGKFKA